MAKDGSVTAFSLRTPLTSLQIAPQYCIHPSTNRFYPPPLATLPTKPEAGRSRRGRGHVLVVLRRSWFPGCNSTSPGITGSEVLLYLGCPQCLGHSLSVSLCLFLRLCPGSQWGTDLEEDPLGQRWCVVGFRHASLFPKWPTNLLSTNCKDGQNLTNSASRCRATGSRWLRRVGGSVFSRRGPPDIQSHMASLKHVYVRIHHKWPP